MSDKEEKIRNFSNQEIEDAIITLKLIISTCIKDLTNTQVLEMEDALIALEKEQKQREENG